MNRLLYGIFLVALILFSACQSDTYKIKGSGSGLQEGDTIYLTDDFYGGTPFASAVVSDGKFRFEGYTDSTTFCLLYNSRSIDLNVALFLEPGTIVIDLSEEPGKSRVTGTSTNRKWQDFNNKMLEYGAKIDSLGSSIYSNGSEPSEEDIVEAQRKFEEIREKFGLYVIETAEKNCENEFGYFLLINYNDAFEQEKRLELLKKMPEKMRKRPEAAVLIEGLEKVSLTLEGNKMPDFIINDIEGKPVNLTEEFAKNEITIIDFWASWCGPCIRKIPEIVKIYETYKDKGLGIIGVSLDENEESWKQAVEENQMKWLQVSDLHNWDSEIVEACGLDFIPYLIVVDKKGIVIARGIDGDKLEELLQERLGKS